MYISEDILRDLCNVLSDETQSECIRAQAETFHDILTGFGEYQVTGASVSPDSRDALLEPTWNARQTSIELQTLLLDTEGRAAMFLGGLTFGIFPQWHPSECLDFCDCRSCVGRKALARLAEGGQS